MTAPDFARLRAALNPETLVPQWLPHGRRAGGEWRATNPTRDDRKAGSFSVNLSTGAWGDFATGDRGGDLISLYAYLHGISQGDAARQLSDEDTGPPPARPTPIDAGKPRPIMPIPDHAPSPTFAHQRHGEPSQVWTYRSASGSPLMHVARFDTPDGKQILPRSWVSEGGRERWAWRGITGTDPRPLYGLDRLHESPNATVMIVEGEKTADAATRLIDRLPFVAVAWLGGTATARRVKLDALEGRNVVLLPDRDAQPDTDPADQPGVKAMRTIGAALDGIAASVRIVEYTPDPARHGWDLADAESEGWDGRQLARLVASAVPLDGAPDVLSTEQAMPLGTWPHIGDKGAPLNMDANLAHLCKCYGITVRYNEMTKAREIKIPGESWLVDNRDNNALGKVASLCALNRMPQSRIAEYLDIIADAHAYHPARDWIGSRPWDGVSRLDALCDTLVSPMDPALKRALLRRWLISIVAAAYERDGVEAHGALILQGPQGAGKSRWVLSLMPDGFVAAGRTVDPGNKDHLMEALAYIVCELGEVDATFRKADIARLKAFVTRRVDELRRPYARAVSQLPRRTIFFGSVNEQRYLVDETGNRRWWTIPVTRVVHDHDIDTQQLFAEVAQLYHAGDPWWLSPDEQQALAAANAEHESVDPLVELIAERYDWDSADRPRQRTATEVLKAIGFDRPTRRDTTRVASILRDMTGDDARKSGGRRVYDLPPLRLQSGGVAGDPDLPY